MNLSTFEHPPFHSSQPDGGSENGDRSVSAVLSDTQTSHCWPEITAMEEV